MYSNATSAAGVDHCYVFHCYICLNFVVSVVITVIIITVIIITVIIIIIGLLAGPLLFRLLMVHHIIGSVNGARNLKYAANAV